MGSIEFNCEGAFVDVLKNDLDLGAVTFNVRRAQDTSTARDNNSIAIDALGIHSLYGCVEYQLKVQIEFETRASVDKTGETLGLMMQAVRCVLNGDDYLDRFNDQQRGIVFHEIKEQDTFDASDGTTRRVIMNLDAQCYIGTQ